MKTPTKRATIYFDQKIHKALRLKAVETERTISNIVNEVVRLGLEEDAEDLIAFEERVDEPGTPFEDVVMDFKRSGTI